MRQRTLRAIRKDAPQQDLKSEALTLAPSTAARAPASRYVPAQLKPLTLTELREACEPFGASAVADARWGALTAWLMWGPPAGLLTNPIAVVNVATNFCRDHDRITQGLPNLSGKPFVSRLPTVSLEAQGEARLVVAETFADWERAGWPHLPNAIKYTHRYIAAYVRQNPTPKSRMPA